MKRTGVAALAAAACLWVAAAAQDPGSQGTASQGSASQGSASQGSASQGPTSQAPVQSSTPEALSAGARIAPSEDVAYPGVISLSVDLTDTDRRVFNVRETISVRPGPLTLLYPEWLPGHHAPRGPIDGLAGLVVNANGRPLDWVRDAVNVFAFHLQVPAGVSRLDVQFDYDSPLLHDQGRTMVTPDMTGLQWNTVVLYPAGYQVRRVNISPSVVLPEGWDFAGALEVESRAGATVHFKQTDLDTLVDSPLLAGRYFKSVELDGPPRAPVRMNVFGDSADGLELRPPQLLAFRRLVQQTYAVMGPPHYDRYEFLLALSDHFGDIGLEHHRSNETRRPPNFFLEWERAASSREVLAHEFTHSWNGKFRRPLGLATADFSTPMHNSLLWVYEGLTNYYGSVLTTRSGLWSDEYSHQAWANLAANLDRNRPGRSWRDLEDTTAQPIITPRRPLSWLSWERTEDYYTEGQLLWLEIDTRIRELTHERRSLDDFARLFFDLPAPQGAPMGPVTYTFADVVQTLNAVAPFAWEKYLTERLYGHDTGAPLDGLTRGGWKLVYTDSESEYLRSLEDQRKALDFTYSLGFSVSLLTGQLTEVRWGGPAYEAGMTLGTALIAVNGREYRPDRLKAAIVAAKTSRQPVELIVKNLDRFRTVKLAWYEGLKYPQLQRLDGVPDRLDAILKPRLQ